MVDRTLIYIASGAVLTAWYLSRHKKLTEEEVQGAIQRWIRSIADPIPLATSALYSSDAVLMGTFAPTYLVGRNAITNYFVELKEKKGLRAELESGYVQLGKDYGIMSGLYTFSWDEGSAKARYTFVVRRSYLGHMEIINHHSSLVP